MRHAIRWAGLLGLTVLMTMLTGCAVRSPDVTYYTLSPVPGSTGTGDGSISLAVGPADFPKALNRTQIITRQSANRVTYDDFNRWAGTLDSDFLATVSVNLSRLLGTDHVAVYPAPPSFPVVYRVTFDVQRFEADASGSVTLETRWLIRDESSGDALALGQFSTRKTAADDDQEARIAAHSEAVGELSAVIADKIRMLAASAATGG